VPGNYQREGISWIIGIPYVQKYLVLYKLRITNYLSVLAVVCLKHYK